jgi:hypothetical protein
VLSRKVIQNYEAHRTYLRGSEEHTILNEHQRAPFMAWKGHPSDICSSVRNLCNGKLKGISSLVLSYREDCENLHCRGWDRYVYVAMITMWSFRIYSYFALRINTKTQVKLAGFITHTEFVLTCDKFISPSPDLAGTAILPPPSHQVAIPHRPPSRLVWRVLKKRLARLDIELGLIYQAAS